MAEPPNWKDKDELDKGHSNGWENKIRSNSGGKVPIPSFFEF